MPAARHRGRATPLLVASHAADKGRSASSAGSDRGAEAGIPDLPLVTKEISGFAAIANGLNLPVLLLAGVLLPISLGPAWMHVLAHVNPLYYLVQASRVLAGGTLSGTAVWQAFAVLVPLCALVLTWATGVLRTAVS